MIVLYTAAFFSIADVCIGYSLGPSVECPCILPGNNDDVSLSFFFSMLFFRSFYIYRYSFIHFVFAIYFHSILFFRLGKELLCSLSDILWARCMKFYCSDSVAASKARPQNKNHSLVLLNGWLAVKLNAQNDDLNVKFRSSCSFREILVCRLYLSILLLAFRLFADVRRKVCLVSF